MSEKNNKKDLKTIIYKEVVNDYYTAGIKAEVIIDMLLRPVLEKVLSQLLEEEDQGVHFITKEFPIPTKDNDTHNCNVDYLMYGKDAVYLIELKTSSTSEDEKQLENYIGQVSEANKEKRIKFGDFFGKRFIWMLNHVSVSGIGDGVLHAEENGDYLKTLKGPLNKYINSILRKECPGETLGRSVIRKMLSNCGKSNGEGSLTVPAWLYLEALVDKIITKKGMNIAYKNADHTVNAVQYLRKTQKSGSAKYLFQAGQILDSNPGNWWENEVQLVYIVPDAGSIQGKIDTIPTEMKVDIKVISIEEIIEKLTDQNEYDKMLNSILNEIFGSKG